MNQVFRALATVEQMIPLALKRPARLRAVLRRSQGKQQRDFEFGWYLARRKTE